MSYSSRQPSTSTWPCRICDLGFLANKTLKRQREPTSVPEHHHGARRIASTALFSRAGSVCQRLLINARSGSFSLGRSDSQRTASCCALLLAILLVAKNRHS